MNLAKATAVARAAARGRGSGWRRLRLRRLSSSRQSVSASLRVGRERGRRPCRRRLRRPAGSFTSNSTALVALATLAQFSGDGGGVCAFRLFVLVLFALPQGLSRSAPQCSLLSPGRSFAPKAQEGREEFAPPTLEVAAAAAATDAFDEVGHCVHMNCARKFLKVSIDSLMSLSHFLFLPPSP